MVPPLVNKVVAWIVPPPKKSADGRDQWPSRTAFLLTAMVLYNNYGLQWFIPYLLAVFLIAIPALILEVSIGQAYRGGTVIAYNNINRRLKGVGLGPVIVSFIVVQYFVVNLAWIMNYFCSSFKNPLHWENRLDDFYWNDVLQVGNVTEGTLSADGKSVISYTGYPNGSVIKETVGFSVFIWFLVWISIVRGVGMTGRVVYFTMGLPILTTIIFREEQLASGEVWQTAFGQVFFSTAIGFGYFTTYASYNQKHSNAVMDAILICGSNVIFENFAALAIFGVVGFLRRWPENGVRLGAFVVGFLTLPEAVLQMPGKNFWAVLLFFTLIVLGFSPAFVMLDVAVTLVCDSGLTKLSHSWVVTILTAVSFLMSLPYCTEFGYYLLDGVDRWVNNIALTSIVRTEVVSATTIYRCSDVIDQLGLPAFSLYNFGFFGAQLLGIALGHEIEDPGAGAGAGIGFYVVCSIAAVFIARAPDEAAPRFTKRFDLWNSNMLLRKFWFLAYYSGNQLRRDLNVIVGVGQNWKIPPFLPFLLRYISGPILAIVFSFAYPEFHTLRYDPMMITGFILAHVTILAIILGYAIPKYYDALIPPERRGEGTEPTIAMQTKGEFAGRSAAEVMEAERGVGVGMALETGEERSSDEGLTVGK
ncbi:SNF-domain-containing protein [Byssothecium circinans]|uniref:SNF-domain-containing protein n=1 Tax=Byssothecium circinans TaxID=147558 RepID=A0A6A5TN06_9PLEO|nr:SNF-domain-containing protein [Byssothecium circinans]